VTFRSCACGDPILPTKKTLAFGKTHGKDLTVWPAKCNGCMVDQAIDLFSSVSATSPVPLAPRCTRCSCILGAKFYADVPSVGDLCLDCHVK
jgi:hypothetical protein